MNIENFKILLQKEKALLESELSTIAIKNSDNPDSWEVIAPKTDRDRADETEVADDLETLENNNAVVNKLEISLKEVNDALAKIENGTYGTCEVCEQTIEEDRLEANPSAKTCKVHMNN